MNDGLPTWKHDLPVVTYGLLKDASSVLTDFYKEHIRRDVDPGTLKPTDYWTTLHGLVVAATQTHAAIGLLLSEKQPKPFILQATILNRSLFEILSTVLALTEKPAERTTILMSETVKMYGKEFMRATKLYGDEPKWKDYLDVFERRQEDLLKGLGLPAEALHEPNLIKTDWPTPGVMLGTRRGTPPMISGTRHAVLLEFYDAHYSSQSAQAHARMGKPGDMLVVTKHLAWRADARHSARSEAGPNLACCLCGDRVWKCLVVQVRLGTLEGFISPHLG
jgi:hypothetical protein